MCTFKILILEDNTETLESLCEAFDWALTSRRKNKKAPDFGIELTTAEDIETANFYLDKKHFHGISIDQNLPLRKGSEVNSENGLQFVKDFVALRVSTFACVYTGKGQINIAVEMGYNGIKKYIEKSTTTVNLDRMTENDYAEWFLDELWREYIRKSLRRTTFTGFTNLSGLANIALKTNLEALESLTDQKIDDALKALSPLREDLNFHLVALTHAFLEHAGMKPEKFGKVWQASVVESWLRKSWSRLEHERFFQCFKTFLNVPAGRTMAEFYLTASEKLRDLRNKRQHDIIKRYSTQHFLRNFDDIVRFLEVLSIFSNTSFIYQPRFEGNKLAFEELNARQNRESKVLLDITLPPIHNPDVVYTAIPGYNKLIDLSSGYRKISVQGVPKIRREYNPANSR